MAIKTSFAIGLALASQSWAEFLTVDVTRYDGTEDSTVNIARHATLLDQATGSSSGVTIVPETFATHTFWYGSFLVGDSKLRLAIDTGSPFVVTDPGLYKPSSASVNDHKNVTVPYVGTLPDACGSYVAYADLYNDTVKVENVEVKNQIVFVTHKHKATQPGEETALPPPFQGIAGFSGGPKDYLFFPNACNDSQVDQCRFGVAYGTGGKGQQILGGIDSSLYDGQLSYSSLYQKSMWAIPGPVLVKNKVFSTNQDIVLDTGTPNIQGPIKEVEAIFKELGLQTSVRKQAECAGGTVIFGYYPCDSPPDITFAVGNKNFGVNPAAAYLTKKGNNCTSTLVGVDYGKGAGTFWLLGQAWMQGKYLDFDLTGNKVGVAILKNPTGPS